MRNWKVGSITAGILLIAIGLLWFLQSFIAIQYSSLLLNAWPIACILLGIEILVFHLLKKEESLKFHWVSIFLLVFVMITSIAYNFGHLVFNELGISLHSTRADINDEKTIPSTIQEIIIDGADGEYNVVGTNTTNLKVNGSIQIPDKKHIKGKLSDYYSVKTIGNKMYVNIKEDHFNFINFNDLKTEINIELPKNLITTIKLNDGSINLEDKSNKTVIDLDDGSININKIDGTLIAKTENGSINLQNATLNNESKISSHDGEINIEQVTGLFNAKTSNGSITVEKANLTKHSSIKTNDGEISVVEFKGEIFAKTNNGAIRFDDAVINGDSQFISDDGEIDLGLIKQNDLNVKAETNDGSIEGNIGWKVKDKEVGNNKEAILGNGTNKVFIQTKNGSISVNSH